MKPSSFFSDGCSKVKGDVQRNKKRKREEWYLRLHARQDIVEVLVSLQPGQLLLLQPPCLGLLFLG
jgi:hypothetical protein